MDLGQCWQPGAWANDSWVEGVWCPEGVEACTPVQIGECWQAVWCEGAWQAGVWCPTGAAPTAGNIFYGDNIQLQPWVMPDRDKIRRKREDEEIIIL